MQTNFILSELNIYYQHTCNYQVWEVYTYQDAHIIIWANIISIIWVVFKLQAGEQVSRLETVCVVAYGTNTKEYFCKICK